MSFVLASLQIISGSLSIVCLGLVVTAMAAVWDRGSCFSLLLAVRMTSKLMERMFHQMSGTFLLCVDICFMSIPAVCISLHALGRCGI